MGEVTQPIIRVLAPRRSFEGHEGTVFAFAFFPDGRRMVTASKDKKLRLWDLKDGVMLKTIDGHQTAVNTVVVSPDGQLVASGDWGGHFIAWKGDTFESLTQPIKVHSNRVRSIDFSPDGSALVSGSWDRTAEQWCTKTWQVQGAPIMCGGGVNCVRYSPSGEFLAIAATTELIICNSQTKERIATLKAVTTAWAHSLAWMPNGTRLFSGGPTANPSIREWDTSTWKQVGDAWTGHAQFINVIALNHNGAYIVSGSDDNILRLWRLSDRQTVAIFKDINEVSCATFSADGTHVLSGGSSMMVKEWAVPDGVLVESPSELPTSDASTSKASSPSPLSTAQVSVAIVEVAPFPRITTPVRAYTGHKNTVHAVAVFPDGHRMVTGSYDNMLHLWNLKDGTLLKKMEGHRGWVWAVAVTRDGKLIASGDDNGELIAWNGDTGECLQAVKSHSGRIRSLDFSPDGAVLATGSTDKTTELWSTATWEVQGNPINCGGLIYCVRFSPSGEYLAISTDSDKDILIYNTHTRECITNLKTGGSPTGVRSLAWMPDGTRLLSGGLLSDPTIREWDTSTWKQVGDAWTGHAHSIDFIAVNPNVTFIVSGSDDFTLRLWRYSDRRTIAIFKGTHELYCGVFSMDGKRIISGGRDMMAKEWALPEDVLLEDIPKEWETRSPQPRLMPPIPAIMAEATQVIPRIVTARRTFTDHTNSVFAVAIFPDEQRMVTTSADQTLLLWNLKDGVVLKKMEGHWSTVRAVAISGDGQLIASGDAKGSLIAWNGTTGESITEAIQLHSSSIHSLDFSPDGTALASGSWDKTTELWCAKTWQVSGNPIICGGEVSYVRYSPSGEFLAIAASDILICNSRTSERIATLKTTISPWVYSLAWTPDGTRIFSGGTKADPNIREWDTSTWKQIGVPWSGHTGIVYEVIVNPAGTLVASSCEDGQVRLWRPSDRQTLAIFKDLYEVYCAMFSADGKHILSGGRNKMIKEWVVPEDDLLEYTPEEQGEENTLPKDAPEEQAINIHPLLETVPEEQETSKRILSVDVPGTKNHALSEDVPEDVPEEQVADERVLFEGAPGNHQNTAQDSYPKMLALSTTVLNACVIGDLPMAEDLLTEEIDGDGKNHISYANRSFVRARKSDLEGALHDAHKSVSMQPSLIGYISKGIALCGKLDFQGAMEAFDLTFMFLGGDLKTTHLVLLIKAIGLFNANQHEQAMRRVYELLTACPSADILACRVVEVYLRVQLGTNALDHNEAVDHFTAAVKSMVFSSTLDIHSKYETLVVLFGWDLKSLWLTANRKWCHALLQAGIVTEALESYRHMLDICDEVTATSCVDWSIGFKQDCGALYTASGDAAFTVGNYDKAIELYSAAIDLDSATDTIFANRSKVKLEMMQWDEALLDAQKVIELNPSSYIGYQLKQAALHGAQHYDGAIEAFQIMLSMLDNSADAQTQELRQRCASLPKAEGAVQKVIDSQLENAPPRLLNTSTGDLCDREAQVNTFKTSTEYKQLLSSIIKDADLGIERIREVVAAYFRYAMLSHRWSEKEPLLQDIQGNNVYQLHPVVHVMKLQSFCKTVRAAGCDWAWSDTCCIDKNNNLEVQESVNTMFVWYSNSALTIIYLSDVPPSSTSGALARCAWSKRGWTVQEFLAPKVVLFYQQDWTLYLKDPTPNHKDSIIIMEELGYATGINAQALVAFRPGMRGAREKLQWASARVTTLQEDMSYSLFGIFGVHLPVIYGEKKQNALGRLLQEIIARSGDISALDWVGKPSEFNSCLPADICMYKALPNTLPSLSEDEVETSISLLRNIVTVYSASKLYNLFDNLGAPRFANCRLHLPCLVFQVTEVRRSRPGNQKVTYEVKANGLRDLSIITDDKVPARQLLLVYPWDCYLLEQPSVADDTQSVEDYPITGAYMPGESESWQASSGFIARVRQPVRFLFKTFTGPPVDSEPYLRALRLIVRLGQPFRAFLLAQQRGGEYRRIASDYDIIAHVQDMTSVSKMTLTDIRTVEIL